MMKDAHRHGSYAAGERFKSVMKTIYILPAKIQRRRRNFNLKFLLAHKKD